MPVASSIQELIDALKTKKTRTMRALDELFGSEEALNRLLTPPHPNLSDLNNPNVFEPDPGDPLPQWAVDELTGAPGARGQVTQTLSPVEIEHINQWPRANKEDLRVALKSALESQPPRPLEFLWELHGGDSEEIDIDTTPTPGRIIFRSPQRNVEVSGWFKAFANLLASIEVNVGPSP